MAPSSKPDAVQTVQLEDGEWVESGRFDRHQCCDCKLVHIVRFKLVDGKLYEQWTRDPVETRKARRKSNKAVVKKPKGR